MHNSFAAVLYRTDAVTERDLSHGFAVALGGWDVPAPHLLITELPGVAGWSVAFYRSGKKDGTHGDYEELEHACELFEDELPPGLCVRDAVAKRLADEKVYAITFTDESLHDDAWCFEPEGFRRTVVREGEDGVEGGTETLDHDDIEPVEVEWPEEATEEREREALEDAVRPLRGSAMLSAELRADVLRALMGALFSADRRVEVRLIDPTPAAMAEEVGRLNRVLRRTAGRGAFDPPTVAGVQPPSSYRAFVEHYDWADPSDPGDLYRELSIGAIEGTLHFFRPDELATLDDRAAWSRAAKATLYPIATLRPSALGADRGGERVVALTSDGESLRLVDSAGDAREAGPTLGELLRYLSLGWSQRDEVEEDTIGALMLRARLRAG